MQAYGLRHHLARIIFWLSILVGIAALVVIFGRVQILPAAVLIGLTGAAFGLSALLGGEIIAGPQPKQYTVKGQVVRGDLSVRAGLTDFTLEMGKPDRVATLHHGPLGKPKLAVQDGIATLKLANGLIPNIARWDAKLATNVLWDIDARTSLGELSLDLSGIRVERVIAQTGWGKLDVTLPTRGYTQLFLTSSAGEITIRIPDEVGARFVIERGSLATLTIQNPRVTALDAKRCSTTDYDTASTQVDIKIEVSSGEITIL
jgi:hypothetical protein